MLIAMQHTYIIWPRELTVSVKGEGCHGVTYMYAYIIWTSKLTFRTDDELQQLKEGEVTQWGQARPRQSEQSSEKHASWDADRHARESFASYRKLITPGFYGNKQKGPRVFQSHDQLQHAGAKSRDDFR
jgi:hypothetical protein